MLRAALFDAVGTLIQLREAVYVGDETEQDIAGARAAGLLAIDVKSLASLADVLQRIE